MTHAAPGPVKATPGAEIPARLAETVSTMETVCQHIQAGQG
jgi:hypothetical protein